MINYRKIQELKDSLEKLYHKDRCVLCGVEIRIGVNDVLKEFNPQEIERSHEIFKDLPIDESDHLEHYKKCAHKAALAKSYLVSQITELEEEVKNQKGTKVTLDDLDPRTAARAAVAVTKLSTMSSNVDGVRVLTMFLNALNSCSVEQALGILQDLEGALQT